MASQSAPRLLVELAVHSLQLALVDTGGRLIGYRTCAVDAAAVAAALAELSPGTPLANVQALLITSTGFVLQSNAEEAASMRTAKSLLARAEAAGTSLGEPLSVVAFDSLTGLRVDTVGASPWIIAGTTTARMDAAKEQLGALGLSVSNVRLALPVRIGSVVTALQDMPESTRVLVWQIGETNAQLACVSASGCEAAGEATAGFPQVFEAVQAGLGLKFRAAAAKLFFNSDYDFSETAGPIAERLAAILRPAIAALGCAPTTLHVAGLPEGQAWLAKAVASALELAPLNPDMPAFCAQRGLTGAVNAELPASALSLLFQGSGSDDGQQPWQPGWLDANAPVVVPAPAPEPASAPKASAPAPAPTPAPAPAPAAAAKATVAPKVVPAAVKPIAPKPAVPVAAAPAPAKPVPTPAPVPVAAAPAPVKAAAAAKPAAAATATAAPKPVAPAPAMAPKAVVPAPTPAPAPVVKAPVAKPQPAAVIVEEPVVEETTAPAQNEAAPKKKPVMLFAAIGAVVVLGGAGAFFMMKGKSSSSAASAAAAQQVSVEELRVREEALARMLADELKTPRSFRNDRYSFEVSDRGVLQKLVGVGNRTIIDEFGWLELQGTFTGTAKPFYAGTIGDKEYVPSINKTIRDGKVVFEISGRHPRFTFESLVTCLPTSVVIHTKFTPINMEEPRGPISGVYTVKMNRQSLSLGQKAVVTPGAVSFATQSGSVVMKFNGDAWGQAGEAGKQTIAVGSNLVFFYFAGGNDPKNNVLTTELTLP